MAQAKKEKPKYDAPKVMPLDELVQGEGQSCHSGGTASNCSIGSHASNNCNNGLMAGRRCGAGGTPGN